MLAVSLVAPFAVVELGDMATFEDGRTADAEIESHAETAEGERIDPEEHFRKANDAPAYQILVKLRAKISNILEKHGITILPPEEWRKPAPSLRGGENTIPGIEGRAMRLSDAFFFEEL